MTLALEQKKQIVADTRESALAAITTVIADYRGMSVSEFTSMRKQARENGVQLQVIRNSLARLALEGTDHECLRDSIAGPTMFAFSPADPGAGARLLKDVKNAGGGLEVKAISVAGKLCSGEELDRVASLPTKDEAIAKLMSVMLGPVTKLTQTMQSIPSKLVRTIAAVRDQKESGA